MIKDTYFNLYKKAKKLYEDGDIELESVSEDSDNGIVTYRFKVKDYLILLRLEKQDPLNPKSIWKRTWSCTCKHAVLKGIKYNIDCPHVKACEYYLMEK